MTIRSRISNLLCRILWLQLATPDIQSKRTLIMLMPGKYKGIIIASWKYGKMTWLENLLAKVYIWPEF